MAISSFVILGIISSVAQFYFLGNCGLTPGVSKRLVGVNILSSLALELHLYLLSIGEQEDLAL